MKLVLAPVLWGGALVAGRVVSADLHPLATTWVRFVLVLLFLFPVLRLREGSWPRPDRRDLLLLLVLSITGVVVYNLLLFSGLRTVTAVRSSVIMALTPAVVAVILGVFFRERVGVAAALGIVAAFSGAFVTITDANIPAALQGGVSTGDLLLLGCVLSWAAYTILARHAMRRLSALAVLTYSSAMGVVLLAPFVFAGGFLSTLADMSLPTVGALLYLSFGAAGLAYLWYYEGIRDVGATRAAVFLNLEPPAAILLGVIILGERLTVPVIVGALLVMTGLYLVNRPSHPDHGLSSAEPPASQSGRPRRGPQAPDKS